MGADVSVGLAALDGSGVTQVTPDDVPASLRLLSDRRKELCALRTLWGTCFAGPRPSP